MIVIDKDTSRSVYGDNLARFYPRPLKASTDD